MTQGGWNKGFTKETSLSVKKISDTMKGKKIDNFSAWREKMRKEGKLKFEYPEFAKDGDLAELIGVTLGDGHICKYPRTEELRIISNANNLGFIKRYSGLIEKIFLKRPYVGKKTTQNCVAISIYEKNISKRLGVPAGARKYLDFKIPGWILRKREYIVRLLRGLYEAEGCHCVHKRTYTYKFQFSNRNESLLNSVFVLMKKLGFSPHKSLFQIQISKKEEVAKAIELLQFRKY